MLDKKTVSVSAPSSEPVPAGGSSPMARFVVGMLRRLHRSYVNNGAGHVARMLLVIPLLAAKRLLRRVYRRLRHSPTTSAPPPASFDQQFHVNTNAGRDAVAALADIEGSNWKHGKGYQAISEDTFRLMLQGLPIRHEEFVFVDIGSGKGKAMLMAADYPFARIIGVEYSRSLHEVAARNVEAYYNPTRKCMDIQSICADALTFDIPNCPCVFFLFNPFNDVILESVVQRIVESFRKTPGPCT